MSSESVEEKQVLDESILGEIRLFAPNVDEFMSCMPELQATFLEDEVEPENAEGFTFAMIRPELERLLETHNSTQEYHNVPHCFRVHGDVMLVAEDFGESFSVAEQIAVVFHDIAHSGVIGRCDFTHNISQALRIYDSFMKPLYLSGRIARTDWIKGGELILGTTSFDAKRVPLTKKGMMVEAMDLHFLEPDFEIFMQESVAVLSERSDRPDSNDAWLESVMAFVAEGGYLEERIEYWRSHGLFDDGQAHYHDDWMMRVASFRFYLAQIKKFEEDGGQEDFPQLFHRNRANQVLCYSAEFHRKIKSEVKVILEAD